MNVITISREYGAGGGETAQRLAEALNWRLLDRELLHQAAAIEHVPDAEIERLADRRQHLELLNQFCPFVGAEFSGALELPNRIT